MARFLPMMAGALALALFTPMAAAASDPGSTPAAIPPPGEPVQSVDGPQPASPFAGAAIAEESILASVTGKADMQILEQIVNAQNTGTVTGNTINGDFTTGTISIDRESFNSFNGMALFSVNTGNNVSINSSMSVNVAFQH
ncbi:hypothetical protein ACFB49_17190 [Sphingomonas sp. DBB INV C78]|uniref:hypothetical protein n=1 Tax=Sphingomonas sp. DBB INV C78 TaxID=3349434 RepID=UPI0036D43F55